MHDGVLMKKQKHTLGILIIIFVASVSLLAFLVFAWKFPTETQTTTEGNLETSTDSDLLTESATESVTESITEPETESITESETESITESETETMTGIDTELTTETETESTTESESEDSSNLTIDEYLGQWELDYVEPPVVRTRQEALEKIKELAEQFPKLQYVYENEDLYTTSMIKALAGNPEMTSYAYDYPTHNGSVTGGIRDDELPENHPLFLQWDPRWGYMRYGTTGGSMGSSGCGPTCLSMAIYYLTGDKSCTPDAVAEYSMKKGHYVAGVGTSWALLDKYPGEYGLAVDRISKSEENLKEELDKGNILICSVRKGNFTSAGHFIVIYGYDEKGFKVNDPKCIYRSRLSWTYEQIKGDIKKTWSIGK